jgi:hypothetical protein
MFAVRFNSQMRWAWFFLSFIFFGWVAIRLVNPAESVAIKLVLAGMCIFNPGLLIALVRAFRGPNRDWRNVAENATPLSAWGYFWRAYVAFLCQGPVLFLVSLVVPLNLHIDRFSAAEMAMWEVPFVLASVLVTWVLFSRDRKGQVAVVITTLRGY